MKSLQRLCLERLSKATWYNLSSHLQALLITDDMRSSFIKLQRSILHRRRRRMQKLIELLTQQLEVSLVPSNAVRYAASEAGFRIKRGDHLVVTPWISVPCAVCFRLFLRRREGPTPKRATRAEVPGLWAAGSAVQRSRAKRVMRFEIFCFF